MGNTQTTEEEKPKFEPNPDTKRYQLSQQKFEKVFKEDIEKYKKLSLKNKDKEIPKKEKKEKEKTLLIFDTDIASDIDDSLALLSLLHLPETDYELLGITTVYGFTKIRTEVTKKILEAHELDVKKQLNIPIITGSNCSLEEFPILQGWHAGTEGVGLLTDEEIAKLKKDYNCFLDRKELLENDCLDAAKFIVEKAKEHSGKLTIVVLGGMTNIAKAYQIEPNLPKMVETLVFMGGCAFDHSLTKPNPFEYGNEYHTSSTHNIRQDQYSCHLVFQAPFNIYCVGNTVTSKMWFQGESVDKLRSLSFHKGTDAYKNDNIEVKYNEEYLKASHIVGTLLDVWLKHRSSSSMKEMKGTCPHDALTTYEAIYNGKYLEYVQGYLIVDQSTGKTCFIYDPIDGNMKVAIDWKDGMGEEMSKLLHQTMFEIIKKV